MDAINKANYYNTIAIIFSLGLAFVLPIELFLFSYVILGPLHYLTEISWLKDKNFFLQKQEKFYLLLTTIVLLLGSGMFIGVNIFSPLRASHTFLLYAAFCAALSIAIFKSWHYRLFSLAIMLLSGFILGGNALMLLVAIYLTTIIHVYIFTGMFMLTGILKTPKASGFVMMGLFLLAPVLCLVLSLPTFFSTPQSFIQFYEQSFKNLNIITLKEFFNIQNINIYTHPLSIGLTRFFAFAYTFHYLNWFLKTNTIKWHTISNARFGIILTFWFLALSFYAYNPILGYKVLFLLSYSHVILEFPLNGIAANIIGKSILTLRKSQNQRT